MLRENDLPLRLIDRRGFIDYLGAQDEPWLRVLLAEMHRFEGRRAHELCTRLAEPLPCDAPHFKRRAATRALWRLWKRERRAAMNPVLVRAELFGAAAADAPPQIVRESVAARLGVTGQALDESLFADLPGERFVRAPDPLPSANAAALLTNLAIAQAVLMRAASLDVRLQGAVRPIVRLAKFRGLLCTVIDDPVGGPVLQISGPFALFRHTLVYGRALAELLPHLSWCSRFELQATCRLWGRIVDVTIMSGDPIQPAPPPNAFDSQLEARFARDFGRLAPDWDLVREPEAVRSGRTLIFPDFLLRHRLHPERRVLLEIVGFWTPAYVAAKLSHLRSAQIGPFILCISSERGCAEEELPANSSVLPFHRRVDAAAVLAMAARLTA